MTASRRDEQAQHRTSVRIVGERQIDEFLALCAALGYRPHQLAAELVLEGIERWTADPNIGTAVRIMARARRLRRAGLTVIHGGHAGNAPTTREASR